jgi:hypothetical protein
MKVALLILILSLIQGCATSNISKDFKLQPNSGKGLVFGTITTDKKRGGHNVVALFYIKSVNGNSHYFESRQEAIPGLSLEPSEFEDVNGRLFATALSPGIYTLDYWQLTQGSLFLRPKGSPPPLEFEVVEGEVVYLGNWHVNFTVGNWFLTRAMNDAVPEIRDYFERDLDRFVNSYPQFKGKEVLKKIPMLGIWSNQSTEREANVPAPTTIE